MVLFQHIQGVLATHGLLVRDNYLFRQGEQQSLLTDG